MGLTVLVLTLAPADQVCGAAGQDLNLSTRFEQAPEITGRIENPHKLPCDECHNQVDRFRVDGTLNTGDDVISLCMGCHPASNIHPVGMPPADSPEKIANIWLPLGKGALKDQVVCTTCHYLHGPEFRTNLLRGIKGFGEDRQENLCSVCHSNRLREKSPHDPESGFCIFCHASPPKPGQSIAQILNPDVQASCDFCHGFLESGHYLSVNPFSDPDLVWDPETDGIPLLSGRFTCVSCHDPHAAEQRGRHLLRDGYLKLAARSTKVNPHWKDALCMTCHESEAKPGLPALRYGGDVVQLCNNCHSGRFARSDLHPVDIKPSPRVKIPRNMPLRNGKLTCETCHDSSLQEGGEGQNSPRNDNPKFLRGGMMARNAFCYQCHLREDYTKLNAHDQISEGNTIKPRSCVFCHSSAPNVKLLGIEHVRFNVESINEFCVECHKGYTGKHPIALHLVRPSREIMHSIDTAVDRIGVELPLYNETIACPTCHNPHQEGVLEIGEAAHGSRNPKRLRLESGGWVCVGCHVDK